MERLRGCWSGYGGHIFPTKADRIMSRYRPIAPKPAMPCISEVERSASSAVTTDNLCIRQALVAPSTSTTSKQKIRRVRKRASKDSEMHLQSAKRVALEAQSNQLLDKSQPPLKVMGCVSSSGEPTTTTIDEDAGFMERAAANAPTLVFPLERMRSKVVHNNGYGYGGCFTELIRGIAGLPTATHVHNLLQHQHDQPPNLLSVFPQQPSVEHIRQQHRADWCSQRQESQGRRLSKDEACRDTFWSYLTDVDQRDSDGARAASEDAHKSGLDEEEIDGVISESKNLMTLNLLPKLLRTADSPPLVSSSSESSHVGRQRMSWPCLRKVCGQSSGPAVLTDDATLKLFGANQAHFLACKEHSRMLAPFTDPLGLPTQMGRFQLQLGSRDECISATLSGLSKKFAVDWAHDEEPIWLTPLDDADFSVHVENNCVPSLTQQHANRVNQLYSESVSSTTVITPQPVRLVGSMVSVESVFDIQNGEAMAGNLETAKRELEEGSLPGLITDTSIIVRWVNTAYKVMVGQPECPWLASTTKEVGGASPTITGQVLLFCNVEVPMSASSFSGRVNVQWTRNTGERTCMTLPCDVSAFTNGCLTKMLLWRLDIQASLSLSCGSGRSA